jgi:hypothetical protein
MRGGARRGGREKGGREEGGGGEETRKEGEQKEGKEGGGGGGKRDRGRSVEGMHDKRQVIRNRQTVVDLYSGAQLVRRYSAIHFLAG